MTLDANSESVERLFDRHVVGRNVLTPTRLKCGLTPQGDAYELCEGEDMRGGTMFGVTILAYDPSTDSWAIDTDRGKLCNEGTFTQRFNAAVDHIRSL